MGLGLIVMVAAAALIVYVYDVSRGVAPDSVTIGLITFSTGVVTTLVGVHEGGTQQSNAAQQAVDSFKVPGPTTNITNNSLTPGQPGAP